MEEKKENVEEIADDEDKLLEELEEELDAEKDNRRNLLIRDSEVADINKIKELAQEILDRLQ